MSLRPVNTTLADAFYYPKEPERGFKDMVDSMIYSNEEVIEQLVHYKENGYRKIQPAETVFMDSLQAQMLLAIVSDPTENHFFHQVH